MSWEFGNLPLPDFVSFLSVWESHGPMGPSGGWAPGVRQLPLQEIQVQTSNLELSPRVWGSCRFTGIHIQKYDLELWEKPRAKITFQTKTSGPPNGTAAAQMLKALSYASIWLCIRWRFDGKVCSLHSSKVCRLLHSPSFTWTLASHWAASKDIATTWYAACRTMVRACSNNVHEQGVHEQCSWTPSEHEHKHVHEHGLPQRLQW